MSGREEKQTRTTERARLRRARPKQGRGVRSSETAAPLAPVGLDVHTHHPRSGRGRFSGPVARDGGAGWGGHPWERGRRLRAFLTCIQPGPRPALWTLSLWVRKGSRYQSPAVLEASSAPGAAPPRVSMVPLRGANRGSPPSEALPQLLRVPGHGDGPSRLSPGRRSGYWVLVLVLMCDWNRSRLLQGLL